MWTQLVSLRALRLAVVLGMSLVAGCSASASGGPLDQGNDSGALCAPVASDGSITVGIETLVNSARESAVIDSVGLADASRLSIIESRVVVFEGARDTGSSLIGVRSGYPPHDRKEWTQSLLASGFEIPPEAVTNDVFNLVLGLRMDADADRATASAIEVRYAVGRARYTYFTTNSIELLRGPCR